MDLCPVNRQWLHTYVLEPFSQGCELFNQAWKGHDCSLAQNPLSLKRRVILALQGLALLLSPIRNIVWLFWQTVGHPEVFVDPFYPEDAFPMSAVKIKLPQFDIRKRKGADSIEKEERNYISRRVIKYWGEDKISKFPWTIIKAKGTVDATNRNPNDDGNKDSSTGQYKDSLLQECTEVCYSQTTFLNRIEPNVVAVRLEGQEEVKKVALLDNLPWIQQRAIGLKEFVLSQDEKTSFCYILGAAPPSEAIPSGFGFIGTVVSKKIGYPRAIKIVAKKIGTEKIQGRECIKIEFTIPELQWLLAHVPASHSHWWFDAKEGTLVKSEDKVAKGPLSCSWGIELDQNNRSP